MMKNNREDLRFAVIGAGAVGCYFGGILARAGHHVTLIGRPHHVSAIQQQGLLLTTQTFEEHIKLHASSELAAIHDADVILFCVKSTTNYFCLCFHFYIHFYFHFYFHFCFCFYCLFSFYKY
jgi:2-dehydropantoate 2-reductase